MAVSYMTEEGYNKILAEINYLETVKRPEISAQIAEARDKGDLSENAEYDAAKDEQRDIEARIEEIEKILKNAEVADDEFGAGVINLGSTVTVYDCEFDEELVHELIKRIYVGMDNSVEVEFKCSDPYQEVLAIMSEVQNE